MTTVVRCARTGRACSEPTCRERHWCREMFERGLSHRGLPLKRKFRPRCCAKTRIFFWRNVCRWPRAWVLRR